MGGIYSPPSPSAPPPSARDRRATDEEGLAPSLQAESPSGIVAGGAEPLATKPGSPSARPAPQGGVDRDGYGFGGGPTSRQGLRGNRKHVRRIAQPEFGIGAQGGRAPDPHKPPTRPSGGQGARPPGGPVPSGDADDAIRRQIQTIRKRRLVEEAAPGAQPWPKTLQ